MKICVQKYYFMSKISVNIHSGHLQRSVCPFQSLSMTVRGREVKPLASHQRGPCLIPGVDKCFGRKVGQVDYLRTLRFLTTVRRQKRLCAFKKDIR